LEKFTDGEQDFELRNLKMGLELTKHLSEERRLLEEIKANPVKPIFIKNKVKVTAYQN
jgi:hypothetical protein